MDAGRPLATLANPIDVARRRADAREGRPDLGLAIVDPLRTTSLAISTGLDPRQDAARRFNVRVSQAGEHVLLLGGRPVPVHGTPRAWLFGASGVELVPGQMFLLEPERAQASIQEALGDLALPPQDDRDALRPAEERSNVLEDRKIELLAASLVDEESLERARALAAPVDSEPDVEAASRRPRTWRC